MLCRREPSDAKEVHVRKASPFRARYIGPNHFSEDTTAFEFMVDGVFVGVYFAVFVEQSRVRLVLCSLLLGAFAGPSSFDRR